MKYSAILFCLFLISCSGTENQTTETTEPVKNSNACEICLLQDSLTTIDFERATPPSRHEEGRQEELEEISEKLGARVDSLILLFKKEAAYTEASNMLLKSDWPGASREPVSVAFQACRLEYPFDKITDEKKREELFLNYYAYTDRHDPFIYSIGEADTSEFLKENGNYMVKLRGEMVRIPFAEFKDYWSQVVASYEKMVVHVLSKRNESVQQLTGKKLDEFSEIELLMFYSHAAGFHHEYSKIFQLLEEDQILQDLEAEVWRMLENSKD